MALVQSFDVVFRLLEPRIYTMRYVGDLRHRQLRFPSFESSTTVDVNDSFIVSSATCDNVQIRAAEKLGVVR